MSEEDWKIKGEERRKLFRRYFDLQMRHVHTTVFKYISEVRSDSCIGDVSEDISDIMYYAYREKPKDPEVVEEMRDIWKKLRETKNGKDNGTSASDRFEQAGDTNTTL